MSSVLSFVLFQACLCPSWDTVRSVYSILNPFSLYVRFLWIIPRVWLPWEAAILRCRPTSTWLHVAPDVHLHVASRCFPHVLVLISYSLQRVLACGFIWFLTPTCIDLILFAASTCMWFDISANIYLYVTLYMFLHNGNYHKINGKENKGTLSVQTITTHGPQDRLSTKRGFVGQVTLHC